MKNFFITTGFLALTAGIVSCGGARGEHPGDIYAPDMTYSRAYETYGYNSNDEYARLRKKGVNYTGLPVPGTMARGDVSDYPYPGNDSGYAMAVNFVNPLGRGPLAPDVKAEAERLYLIHCGICHGTKLDGNGPLWNGGDGPYPVAPRNLMDDYTKKLADGQIYHVIMHGKGQMGSYASQVKPEERWWLVNYIREKQGLTGGADTTTANNAAAGAAAGTTSGSAASGANAATDTTTSR